jgi:uncharacterized protein (TIGR01777 family)
MHEFTYKTRFPVSAETLFNWHEHPGAFQRLNPPFMPVRVLHDDGSLRDGAAVTIRVPDRTAGIRWRLEHFGYKVNDQFCDRQTAGPFRSWEHCHRFQDMGEQTCLLEDIIRYAWPADPLTGRLADLLFRKTLNRLFRFRHTRTANDLLLQRRYGRAKPLRFLIAGSSGMLGAALISFLTTCGHQVTRLVRTRNPSTPWWSPEHNFLDPAALEGYDVIINLAGENIGSGLWTKQKRKRIYESRVPATRLIAEAIASLDDPPRLFIVASGSNYYGNRGEEPLTEASPRGEGFLAGVAAEWEQASLPAAERGVRTVNLRSGAMLSGRHDILARLRPIWLAGCGAVMGNPQNYFPWIAIDDVIGAVCHIITTPRITGPVNLVSPRTATAGDFYKILGKALRRPVFMRIPGIVIKTAMGRMGEELLLNSTRILPSKLQETGFQYLFTDLEAAMRFYLGRQ